VNIDLEIGGKKWNMTVSPVHAVIIYHFQTKDQWTAKELVFIDGKYGIQNNATFYLFIGRCNGDTC